MWDLVENEYSKKYGIGCATFFRDKQLKTAMVMYKYNGRSVMFCYSEYDNCLLYTSPSPRDGLLSRMPSSA